MDYCLYNNAEEIQKEMTPQASYALKEKIDVLIGNAIILKDSKVCLLD